MIGADAIAWLELWERAASKSPRRRRQELLSCSGLSTKRLEIGRANAQLLRLHRAMFGPLLSCCTECPRCEAALEMEVDADEMLAREPAEPARSMQLQVGEWEISFRLPTEEDVDAVRDEGALFEAESSLLRRCVEACRRGPEEASISLGPPELGARISARMEESDPLAILDFELSCMDCGHAWSSTLEVDVFLWTRLNAWAHRLTRDVHTLAKVYGWTERAILEMSPWRRQLYLDMVEG